MARCRSVPRTWRPMAHRVPTRAGRCTPIQSGAEPAATGSRDDVAGLEGVCRHGLGGLDLVELPVPGLPADRPNEAETGSVLLQPVVGRIAGAAGHVDV